VTLKRSTGFQKKYLRGLAHGMDPVVFLGHKGLTGSVIKAVHDALTTHELIKVKFIDLKDKKEKEKVIGELEEKVGCEKAGMIGHTAILYRQNSDPEKRKIILPERKI
jgi:RNA-binding protein